MNTENRVIFKAESAPWLGAFCHAAKEAMSRGLKADVWYKGKEFITGGAAGARVVLTEPDPSIYPELDRKYAENWARITKRDHGMILPEQYLKDEFSFAKIACAYVSSSIGMEYDPGLFLPRAERAAPPSGANGLALCAEDREAVEMFLEGYGLEPKVEVLSESGTDPFDALWTYDVRCVGVPNFSEEIIVLRSCYPGFQHLKSFPAVLARFDGAPENGRFYQNFSAVLMYEKVENWQASLVECGRVWEFRDRFDHDHLRFLRETAKK